MAAGMKSSRKGRDKRPLLCYESPRRFLGEVSGMSDSGMDSLQDAEGGIPEIRFIPR